MDAKVIESGEWKKGNDIREVLKRYPNHKVFVYQGHPFSFRAVKEPQETQRDAELEKWLDKLAMYTYAVWDDERIVLNGYSTCDLM